ncbi:transposon Ty3-I Gag-Pol polyprotein [Trichonephila clavipes]|nr:transposon Ty3-I Gag-Pol polyprotein [Trichonephila clavipes]
MTGNQLDVIIDKKPIRALVDSGASFSVISDKYRRFLKKVLFADAKSVMLKVADGNFVRPIGKCVLRVRKTIENCLLNLLFYHIVAMYHHVADMLSMYVDVEQKNWDEILPFVTFAYNTAKQETTGFTPFYLLHGREAETTLDTMLPFCPNDFDDNNITKIAARAEESRQLARTL